jgi:hypothetical protein
MTWTKAIELLEVARRGDKKESNKEGLGFFGLMHKEKGGRNKLE